MHKAEGAFIPPPVGGISHSDADSIPAPHKKIARATGRGHDRLTDTRVRTAKPDAKPYKLFDGHGLYLLVEPGGARYWRLKYRLAKAEKTYAVGVYPEITLAAARAERDRAREWVRQGLDPVVQRRIGRNTATAEQDATFATVAEQWYAGKLKVWSAAHQQAQRRLLDRFLLPGLGALPIANIETPHVIEALRAVERIGAHELLSKSRVIVSQVFRYAIATGKRTTDPTLALAGAFVRPPVVNRATVPAAEFPALFKALAKTPAELNTRLALLFVFATVTRPGETRFATWSEIDHAKKLWRISAERMKMRAPFVQPLTPLALSILERAKELRQTHEPDQLIFPGYTRYGALSENAFIALLARCGFHRRQSAHGIRAAFKTWAGEWEGDKEFDPVAVELCLAHRQGGVAGTYDRGEYIPARRRILTHWAEHLVECGLRLP